MKTSAYWYILTLSLIMACSSDDEGQSNGNDANDWLIPQNEVRDGGPGQDGIPALENPAMISLAEADYLVASDLVVGFVSDGEARAYSHKVMDWHEIANDNVGGKNIAITYCPLTGTAMGWNRQVGGEVTTFGVSGLLYNTNLMPFDRSTESRWSQLQLQCVNGELIGEEIETYQLFETTWETWQSMFPNSRVISTETGHSRNYQRYPYGSYRDDSSLIFPVSDMDDRLHPKERVHGIISDGDVKAYRLSHFDQSPIIRDSFDGKELVLVGNSMQNFIVSFEVGQVNGEDRTFSIPEGFNTQTGFSGNIVLVDQFGNGYNVFGQVQSGPNPDAYLTPTRSLMGFWFSWAPFYGRPELYEP